MTNSDNSLIKRIGMRDEEAFETLVDRHSDALRRHLMRTVRDDDAAGDLLQEVLLRVWTRAEQWDGRGGVKSWLFTIATNLALNHLRTVRRRREQPLDPPMSPEREQGQILDRLADMSGESPDKIVERAEQYGRLRQLVDALPDERRELWRLIHDGDMDMLGAAETLGIPEGTVKSRLYHTRKQLAREWSEIVKEWENIE
jgi:RNA polymerase sigma-70 factor, ECF subfamily